jgi:hypothetical protein
MPWKSTLNLILEPNVCICTKSLKIETGKEKARLKECSPIDYHLIKQNERVRKGERPKTTGLSLRNPISLLLIPSDISTSYPQCLPFIPSLAILAMRGDPASVSLFHLTDLILDKSL